MNFSRTPKPVFMRYHSAASRSCILFHSCPLLIREWVDVDRSIMDYEAPSKGALSAPDPARSCNSTPDSAAIRLGKDYNMHARKQRSVGLIHSHDPSPGHLPTVSMRGSNT
jgi:hypothetical protein